MSNFTKLLDKFKENFPEEFKPKIDIIKNFITNYIQRNNLTVKFLNSCSAGFFGVRTKDQIIICSPANMKTIGDFLYTIFHEIRHEQQIRDIKMKNPFVDYDLNDFESLYNQYWEMELDSDQFAKNMVAKLVIKLQIPLEFAIQQFKLSSYIENYPMMSRSVEGQIKQIVDYIKQVKRSDGKFEDIQDHPTVSRILKNLEDFI